MSNHLHIVSFDVPYPPNYGGVIDVFYKLKWLHHIGIKIHLHCFQYGREKSEELNKYCEEVIYYNRPSGLKYSLSKLPYTVATRKSDELKKNLLRDNHPILFEVLNTCFLLKDKAFAGRLKIYRHSNIEHDYYRGLAKSEPNLIKRIYFNQEANKLQKFEPIIANADYILSVNEHDKSYFEKKYKSPKTIYLPSFTKFESVISKTGKGNYILYQGNLSINENIDAALWLIDNVFCKINFSVKIAGLNPPQRLISKIQNHKNIELIVNPNEDEMSRLIENAHIHVLYTDQATGLKLKLLNVLFTGRHILTNQNMLEGSGIFSHSGLSICNSGNEFVQNIEQMMSAQFDNEHIIERKKALALHDNFTKAETINHLISKWFSQKNGL
ncbi:MAG: glycosyltransferase family 1 protein [Bacteroidia bacterium]